MTAESSQVPSAFVHLHVHSEYSLVDGMIRDDAFSYVHDELGQSALAITDHGTLGYLFKAQKAADRAGIKLIAGLEAYVAIGERHGVEFIEVAADDSSADEGANTGDSDAVPGVKRRYYEHLTLLAATPAGWRNLLALSNEAEYSKYRGKPRIDYDLLALHAEGLIVLTGCLGGPVLGPLSRGEAEIADRNVRALINAVGADNVYVEIMEHGIAEESAILPDAVALAERYGLGVVATNDAHYTRPEDATAHRAWTAHASKSTLANPKFTFHGEGYHLASEAEMRAKRPERWWQEACDRTAEVAARIEPRVLPEPRVRLPRFPRVPDHYGSSLEYFVEQVRAGAHRIYGPELPQPVRDRLSEEAVIIRDMGFADYFLIVADMLRFAREAGIVTGAGRGSAAGSLVSYCLGITSIDPLEHGLLFERFLEPGREGMPDIDSDFEAARRAEVFAYLAELYGADHVARISNYGFSRTKKALKDAARVLGYRPAIANRLAKEVPLDGGKPLTFEQLRDPARRDADPFRAAVASGGEEASRVVWLAEQFEDLVSTIGIHACGFLIADEPIAKLLPLRRGSDGTLYTTWDGADVEAFGLCKIDILGLQNLDILGAAFKMIEQRGGPHLTIETLPHPSTRGDFRVDRAYQIIREGKTAGIFQLEGDGVTETTVDIQPTTWNDLSAILAMYRPGPMAAGVHTRYGALKRGEIPVSYDELTTDPEEQRWLASVLDSTYGLLIMQEQAMRLGGIVAGFNASWRSKLRKAMGKKVAELMNEVGAEFFARAGQEFRDATTGEVISPAFSHATAQRVWELIKANASYAFNASHSAAYAKTTFATAYVKGNWAAEFGAALLSVGGGRDERRLKAFAGLARDGVEVLPPDINRSGTSSTPEGARAVRLGLSEIKGIASHGEALVAERERLGGRFSSLAQVAATSDEEGKPIPVNVLEALIAAGALDDLADGNRLGLMAVARAPASAVPPLRFGTIEHGQRQRQAVLRAFGEHPLARHQEQVRSWVPLGIANPSMWREELRPVSDLPTQNGARVSTIGVLAGFSERSYSAGKLAEVTLEGSRGSISGVMWNDDLLAQRESPGIPDVGSIVHARGRVRVRELEREDEETGEVLTEYVRELNVSALDVVDVPDDSQTVFPPTGRQMPRFARAADLQAQPAAAGQAQAAWQRESDMPDGGAPAGPGRPLAPVTPLFPAAPTAQATPPRSGGAGRGIGQEAPPFAHMAASEPEAESLPAEREMPSEELLAMLRADRNLLARLFAATKQ